jgi:hypothetical protein
MKLGLYITFNYKILIYLENIYKYYINYKIIFYNID